MNSIPYVPAGAPQTAQVVPTEPVAQPVVQPVAQPVAQPIVQPVMQPIVQPVMQSVMQPVAQPVAQPIMQQGMPPFSSADQSTINHLSMLSNCKLLLFSLIYSWWSVH